MHWRQSSWSWWSCISFGYGFFSQTIRSFLKSVLTVTSRLRCFYPEYSLRFETQFYSWWPKLYPQTCLCPFIYRLPRELWVFLLSRYFWLGSKFMKQIFSFIFQSNYLWFLSNFSLLFELFALPCGLAYFYLSFHIHLIFCGLSFSLHTVCFPLNIYRYLKKVEASE